MIFFFHFRAVFVFVHYRGDEITDVVLVRQNRRAAHAPLLIIHYLSPLHIYAVKTWQWRFAFYVSWKHLFNTRPFITGLSDEKQPCHRLVNLYFCSKRNVSVPQEAFRVVFFFFSWTRLDRFIYIAAFSWKNKLDVFRHFYLSVLSRYPFCLSRKLFMEMVEQCGKPAL